MDQLEKKNYSKNGVFSLQILLNSESNGQYSKVVFTGATFLNSEGF